MTVPYVLNMPSSHHEQERPPSRHSRHKTINYSRRGNVAVAGSSRGDREQNQNQKQDDNYRRRNRNRRQSGRSRGSGRSKNSTKNEIKRRTIVVDNDDDNDDDGNSSQYNNDDDDSSLEIPYAMNFTQQQKPIKGKTSKKKKKRQRLKKSSSSSDGGSSDSSESSDLDSDDDDSDDDDDDGGYESPPSDEDDADKDLSRSQYYRKTGKNIIARRKQSRKNYNYGRSPADACNNDNNNNAGGKKQHQQNGGEPIRPGDIIEYQNTILYTAGSTNHGFQQAVVLATLSLSTLNETKTKFPLALNTGACLPSDICVRRIFEYVDGELYKHQGMLKPIAYFRLKDRQLPTQDGSTITIATGILQKAKQLESIKDILETKAVEYLRGDHDHDTTENNTKNDASYAKKKTKKRRNSKSAIDDDDDDNGKRKSEDNNNNAKDNNETVALSSSSSSSSSSDDSEIKAALKEMNANKKRLQQQQEEKKKKNEQRDEQDDDEESDNNDKVIEPAIATAAAQSITMTETRSQLNLIRYINHNSSSKKEKKQQQQQEKSVFIPAREVDNNNNDNNNNNNNSNNHANTNNDNDDDNDDENIDAEHNDDDDADNNNNNNNKAAAAAPTITKTTKNATRDQSCIPSQIQITINDDGDEQQCYDLDQDLTNAEKEVMIPENLNNVEKDVITALLTMKTASEIAATENNSNAAAQGVLVAPTSTTKNTSLVVQTVATTVAPLQVEISGLMNKAKRRRATIVTTVAGNTERAKAAHALLNDSSSSDSSTEDDDDSILRETPHQRKSFTFASSEKQQQQEKKESNTSKPSSSSANTVMKDVIDVNHDNNYDNRRYPSSSEEDNIMLKTIFSGGKRSTGSIGSTKRNTTAIRNEQLQQRHRNKKLARSTTRIVPGNSITKGSSIITGSGGGKPPLPNKNPRSNSTQNKTNTRFSSDSDSDDDYTQRHIKQMKQLRERLINDKDKGNGPGNNDDKECYSSDDCNSNNVITTSNKNYQKNNNAKNRLSLTKCNNNTGSGTSKRSKKKSKNTTKSSSQSPSSPIVMPSPTTPPLYLDFTNRKESRKSASATKRKKTTVRSVVVAQRSERQPKIKFDSLPLAFDSGKLKDGSLVRNKVAKNYSEITTKRHNQTYLKKQHEMSRLESRGKNGKYDSNNIYSDTTESDEEKVRNRNPNETAGSNNTNYDSESDSGNSSGSGSSTKKEGAMERAYRKRDETLQQQKREQEMAKKKNRFRDDEVIEINSQTDDDNDDNSIHCRSNNRTNRKRSDHRSKKDTGLTIRGDGSGSGNKKKKKTREYTAMEEKENNCYNDYNDSQQAKVRRKQNQRKQHQHSQHSEQSQQQQQQQQQRPPKCPRERSRNANSEYQSHHRDHNKNYRHQLQRERHLSSQEHEWDEDDTVDVESSGNYRNGSLRYDRDDGKNYIKDHLRFAGNKRKISKQREGVEERAYRTEKDSPTRHASKHKSFVRNSHDSKDDALSLSSGSDHLNEPHGNDGDVTNKLAKSIHKRNRLTNLKKRHHDEGFQQNGTKRNTRLKEQHNHHRIAAPNDSQHHALSVETDEEDGNQHHPSSIELGRNEKSLKLKKLTPKSHQMVALSRSSSSNWDHRTPQDRSSSIATKSKHCRKSRVEEPMDSTRKRQILSSSSDDDDSSIGASSAKKKTTPRTPWSTDCEVDSPSDHPPSTAAKRNGSASCSSRRKKSKGSSSSKDRSHKESGAAIFEFDSNDENDNPVAIGSVVKKRNLSPKFIASLSNKRKSRKRKN